MKILKILGLLLVVVIVGVISIGLFTTKNYDVNRTTVINAKPETVYKDVSSFSEFNKWNPWYSLDTNVAVTITGNDGEVGQKYAWKGNDKAGEGSMTFTKLEANKTVEEDLHFVKPFESKSTVYLNLEEANGGTKVTWGFKGESGFVERIFMTLMGGMDKAVGKDYEKGLASLKTLCESIPAYEVKEVDWAEKNCLSVREVVKFADMPKFFSTNYPKMFEAVGKGGAKPGMPLAVFYKYDDQKEMNADLAAAIPYQGKKVAAKGFANLNLPATKGYAIDYFGPYNNEMKKTYAAMDAKLKQLGKTNPAMVIEEYITDPMTEKDSTKWHTKIYFFTN
jgi:effector-binding domain-containing protein